MKAKMTITAFLILVSWFSNTSFSQLVERKTGDLNVIYGDKHIFTVETPEGWTNDKNDASVVGLVNLFYATVDSSVKQKSYLYTMGYDKDKLNSNLDEFIKGDLETYRKKYPNFKYELVNIEFSDGVKNGKLYSFSHLKDRYKEEVLYAETEPTIIVFSFSATTEMDYSNYQSVFDKFVQSFIYRGDNPKPFLDYMKENNQPIK